MPPDTNKHLPAVALPLFRQAATGAAAARVAVGVAALAWPSVPARAWTGASKDELTADVLGRALGARDLALGLGTLAAIRNAPASPWPSGALYAAGALSDALDVAITVVAWPRLPKTTRWLIVAASAGAALAGAAGALASFRAEGAKRVP
jgi:hypothetical protein